MNKLSCYIEYLGPYVTSWNGDIGVTRAVCDSRQVRPGDMFCAMRGERSDGHDFIPQALAAGAVALLVERTEAVPPGVPFIAVERAYQALGLVAEMSFGFPAADLELYGITGTNGKTTTTWLLRDCLRANGDQVGMLGTVEYDMGDGRILSADRTTPTAFELQELLDKMRQAGTRKVIMEISSHALALGRLGRKFQCVGAVFTNLTRDHLDYHHNFENYYQSKKLLFTQHLKPGAAVVINGDDEWGQRLAAELEAEGINAHLLKFGTKSGVCAYCLEKIVQDSQGTCLQLATPNGGSLNITSPLTGRYNADNLACAAILAEQAGLSDACITTALAHATGAPGRLQRIHLSKKNYPATYVDYAHTDDALRKALLALRAICPADGKLAVVFGCGGNRDKTKRPLMGKAAEELADLVFVTSDNPRFEEPNNIINDILAGMSCSDKIRVEVERRKALQLALRSLGSQDILLVAGKGHEDYQEIQGQKHHFSDAEVIAELVEN